MNVTVLAGAIDRWFLLAAVLVSTGAAAFRVLVAGRAGADTRDALTARVARLGMLAAVVALVAALGRLPLQLIDLRDPDSPLGPQTGALITATLWGSAWIAQLICAALAATAYGLARRGGEVQLQVLHVREGRMIGASEHPFSGVDLLFQDAHLGSEQRHLVVDPRAILPMLNDLALQISGLVGQQCDFLLQTMNWGIEQIDLLP